MPRQSTTSHRNVRACRSTLRVRAARTGPGLTRFSPLLSPRVAVVSEMQGRVRLAEIARRQALRERRHRRRSEHGVAGLRAREADGDDGEGENPALEDVDAVILSIYKMRG